MKFTEEDTRLTWHVVPFAGGTATCSADTLREPLCGQRNAREGHAGLLLRDRASNLDRGLERRASSPHEALVALKGDPAFTTDLDCTDLLVEPLREADPLMHDRWLWGPSTLVLSHHMGNPSRSSPRASRDEGLRAVQATPGNPGRWRS